MMMLIKPMISKDNGDDDGDGDAHQTCKVVAIKLAHKNTSAKYRTPSFVKKFYKNL